MYADIDEQVVIARDCEATLIPFGNKITLKKGEEGHITQALGGSYTVMIRGNLVRVEGKDADAIGKIPEVQPWLEEIEAERKEKFPDNPWLGFGSVELCWAMGDRIQDETSLLYWVAKHRIPMVIPGLSDGSIGAQLFMHRQKNPNFMVDFLADEQILSDLTWTAEESHALMVGGGISKHHVIWWNQYRDGLDSAVGITTAPEHDGSLSGARLKEAISWGKIRPEAPQVVVEGDASVLLPLLGADLFRN